VGKAPRRARVFVAGSPAGADFAALQGDTGHNIQPWVSSLRNPGYRPTMLGYWAAAFGTVSGAWAAFAAAT
jgi:hypothetical protein